MFCARCGTQLQPNSVACLTCGRRIGDPVSAIAHPVSNVTCTPLPSSGSLLGDCS